MKGIDILCASQASTSICLSMDHASSSSTIQLGGRAIDRHNPIIRDGRRTPSSAQTPTNPKSQNQHQKSRKSTSSKPSERSHEKSSAKGKEAKRKSFSELTGLSTPPGSSRYLLSDKDYLDGVLDYEPVLALAPADQKKTRPVNQDGFKVSKAASSSSASKPSSSDQVVVLRVSLHCKGCEGKVRKHLSRMEGVTSFSIDFAAKKVTIIGDVTPLNVLASVSKVKSAQFWLPTSSALASTKLDDIKK